MLIGSKQKIEVFDCNNDNNAPNCICTWVRISVYSHNIDAKDCFLQHLPSNLLGLKCEDEHAMILLGQQHNNNTNGSFLSFDTTTKYNNLELWKVKLPGNNMEKTPTISTDSNGPNIAGPDNAAILNAIQSLQMFMEDQFRRVNERLDRIETTLNIIK